MIDLRRLRVSIEIEGKLNVYEGLNITASGTKYTNPLQNECSVVIIGLNNNTREYLLTEASPYNDNRKPKKIIVEAGRQSTGLHQVFIGDIISIDVSPPPEIALTIKAKTNNANGGKVVTFDGAPLMTNKEIAEKTAEENELKLDFQAIEKNIANFSFSGVASKMIEKIQEFADADAFVDDDTLIVKDRDKAIEGRKRKLNVNSGLVGVPKATEKGVEITYLVDGESDLGGQLELESKINPSLNGDYKIQQLKFSLATHNDNFFYSALCERL